MPMAKSSTTIKSTLSAIRFDGHGSLPVQYEVHCPMQHVHGYSESHWMPPLGDYSLRIAPAAALATSKQTTINKYTKRNGHFDGRGSAPVQYSMHCLIEEA
jgi:hypothetical protein